MALRQAGGSQEAWEVQLQSEGPVEGGRPSLAQEQREITQVFAAGNMWYWQAGLHGKTRQTWDREPLAMQKEMLPSVLPTSSELAILTLNSQAERKRGPRLSRVPKQSG